MPRAIPATDKEAMNSELSSRSPSHSISEAEGRGVTASLMMLVSSR